MWSLGVDVGGSKALACLVNPAREVVAAAQRPTGRSSPPETILAAIDELTSILTREARAPDAIGVGFPGLVDSARGNVLSSVMLDGWKDVPLARLVRERLGLRCVVDNDVNAWALGELAARRNEVAPVSVVVAVGTGIGGAILIDGRILRGSRGLAGEIGNTTIDWKGPVCWGGRRGSLNALASGSALEGRPFLKGARALATGLSNVVHLLNPGLVVLGGGVVEHGGDDFLEAVDRLVRVECFPEMSRGLAIERAVSGSQGGALGAALLPAPGILRTPRKRSNDHAF